MDNPSAPDTCHRREGLLCSYKPIQQLSPSSTVCTISKAWGHWGASLGNEASKPSQATFIPGLSSCWRISAQPILRDARAPFPRFPTHCQGGTAHLKCCLVAVDRCEPDTPQASSKASRSGFNRERQGSRALEGLEQSQHADVRCRITEPTRAWRWRRNELPLISSNKLPRFVSAMPSWFKRREPGNFRTHGTVLHPKDNA